MLIKRAVELLDPRWKEQRQKAESRMHNLGAADVSANLKRLASQRQEDGAGTPGQAPPGGPPGAGPVAEEDARRKRAQLGGEGMDVSEQIRKIHERFRS